jgi:hypothetical protein
MENSTNMKTEKIVTSQGTYECEVIELGPLTHPDKSILGTRPTEKDYNRLIQANTVVYVEGKRAVVFLKKAMTSLLDIKIGSKDYKYWKWVSKALCSAGRGIAGGKEFVTERGRRYTKGQVNFFRGVAKGQITNLEEARKVIDADTSGSMYYFYIDKLKQSGYYDVPVMDALEAKIRKKATPFEEKEALRTQLDDERLVWFEKWLKEWVVAEDKKTFAAEAYKKYTTTQTYANNTYSNVLGILDRSARVPFGRWTASTARKFDEFVSQQHIYKQASNLYKDTMPDDWAFINSVMKKRKDSRYTLLGTDTFSTLTVNWNFETFYHYDGNNNPGGVAVLTALTNETYDGEKFDGSYFVLPALGLAFDIRSGDFFVGDNQSLAHGQTKQTNKCEDVDNIVYVFYARESVTKLETWDVECCRRAFVEYAKGCLGGKYGKGEDHRFMGLWGGMYQSEEWIEYKGKHCPEASNQTYTYTEETV